jgi:hypothetical protein
MIFRAKKLTLGVLCSAIILLMVTTISITFIGCSSTPEDATPGYVSETYTKRGISFSFQYPDDYEKNESVYEEESDERDYISLQYYASINNDTLRKVINIQLWNPTQDWQDARTKLDYYADNLDFTGEDVVIHERSPLQVAEVDGEKMVFSMVVEDITNMPNRLTGWIAAFDYRDQIWFLVVTTNMEPTDEVEADFVHLIESFKFPD